VLNSAGWGSLHRCEPEPAIDFLRRAIRLSPLDPEMGTMLWGLAYAELMNGKNEDALSLLDQAIHESPNNVAVYRAQILALVRLGREEAARDAVQKNIEAQSSRPNFDATRGTVPRRSLCPGDGRSLTLGRSAGVKQTIAVSIRRSG